MKTSNTSIFHRDSHYASIAIFLLTLLFSINFLFAQTANEEGSLLANAPSEESSDLLAPDKKSVATPLKMTTEPRFKSTAVYADVNEYIYKYLIYPEEAKLLGSDGSVDVRFEILENGAIGKMVILRSADESLSQSVRKLIKEMPNWSAALAGSTPIKSVYELRVRFRLQ